MRGANRGNASGIVQDAPGAIGGARVGDPPTPGADSTETILAGFPGRESFSTKFPDWA